MIEAGQYDADWPDWHLGPEQSVLSAQRVRAKALIPVHWGLFRLAHHGWTEPVERVLAAARCTDVPVITPRPGQSIEPTALKPGDSTRWWPDARWATRGREADRRDDRRRRCASRRAAGLRARRVSRPASDRSRSSRTRRPPAAARSAGSCRPPASPGARRGARRCRRRCRAPAASCPRPSASRSAARISAAPAPWRRARRCTSIFATSARCGWFSGWARITCTVPTMPCASSATSSTRSPRATPSATLRQNASALSRVIGSMKLTDAPPSTQSTSTSASACELRVGDGVAGGALQG